MHTVILMIMAIKAKHTWRSVHAELLHDHKYLITLDYISIHGQKKEHTSFLLFLLFDFNFTNIMYFGLGRTFSVDTKRKEY